MKVDFDAVIKNALFFKRILGKSRLCAVLKNDAYGHGIVRTASALGGIADFFAVGTIAEALSVEQFCQNILVLLPTIDPTALQTAILHNFAMTVDSFCTLRAVREAASGIGKKARVHLKINTGMNRLGFAAEDLPQLAAENFSMLDVEGIFSHFWGDELNDMSVQAEKFLHACHTLADRFEHPPIRHIANTCGVLADMRFHLDMARVGLGLYGYGAPQLVPAKTVTAKVIAVHGVHAGETVGYDASYVFPHDTRIAVVNAGYATGFPRALKNSRVKIVSKNGILLESTFNTVGNICMAMLAVDVGNADVRVGDDVILLGNGVNNANSDVIVYELLCNLK